MNFKSTDSKSKITNSEYSQVYLPMKREIETLKTGNCHDNVMCS